MKNSIWFLHVLALSLPLLAMDSRDARALTPATTPPSNCTITIQYTLKTGKEKVKIYTSKTANEEECKKRSKLHATNFSPQIVTKKTVAYKFEP